MGPVFTVVSSGKGAKEARLGQKICQKKKFKYPWVLMILFSNRQNLRSNQVMTRYITWWYFSPLLSRIRFKEELWYLS